MTARNASRVRSSPLYLLGGPKPRNTKARSSNLTEGIHRRKFCAAFGDMAKLDLKCRRDARVGPPGAYQKNYSGNNVSHGSNSAGRVPCVEEVLSGSLRPNSLQVAESCGAHLS